MRQLELTLWLIVFLGIGFLVGWELRGFTTPKIVVAPSPSPYRVECSYIGPDELASIIEHGNGDITLQSSAGTTQFHVENYPTLDSFVDTLNGLGDWRCKRVE